MITIFIQIGYENIMFYYAGEEIFLVLIIAALLAFIPANIAKNKGYEFGTWYIYGLFLFIIAFVHSMILKDISDEIEDEDNEEENNVENKNEEMIVEDLESSKELDKIKIITMYKKLLDDNALTQKKKKKVKKDILND